MTEDELIEKISYALSAQQLMIFVLMNVVQEKVVSQKDFEERMKNLSRYRTPFQQGWQKFFRDPLPRASNDKDFWRNLGIDDLLGPSSGPMTD
jgi:hypothetical protein